MGPLLLGPLLLLGQGEEGDGVAGLGRGAGGGRGGLPQLGQRIRGGQLLLQALGIGPQAVEGE